MWEQLPVWDWIVVAVNLAVTPQLGSHWLWLVITDKTSKWAEYILWLELFTFMITHCVILLHILPSVLWHCRLGASKSIRPVKIDEVLAWLSVWSEVQIICIWFSRCHCHPISCLIEMQNGFTFLVLDYPDCPGKEAVKRVFGLYCFTCNIYFAK